MGQDQKSCPGLVSVFYGDGKGKTTAALGMAVRALGQGLRVHLIQFMKGGRLNHERIAGELRALGALAGFTVEQFGGEEWIAGELTQSQVESVRNAVEASQKAISSGDYDLVVLDEILYAVSFGAISVRDVLSLLERKNHATDVVLTGGWTEHPGLVNRADLVTEMKKRKHPFDLGAAPRKGVEY